MDKSVRKRRSGRRKYKCISIVWRYYLNDKYKRI
jgi:hypothetical protein